MACELSSSNNHSSHKDQTVNPACAEESYQLATSVSPRPLHWTERPDHEYQLATAFTKTTAHAAAKIAPPGDAHQLEAGEMSPGH